MRGLRSTLALVIVLAGLGAYVYFVTWKKSDNDTGPKKERVFATFRADRIDEIRVKSAAGEITTVKKQDGDWTISDPITAKVDDAHLNGITGQLATAEISRAIDDNPTDLKDYGLLTPRIEVDYKGPGDKDYQRLFIGEKTPTGIDIFAKRNDEKRVFVIPAYVESAFNVSTFDLRDKTVLKFDHDKVDGIELTAEGKTFELGKDGSDWKLKKPIQAKADAGAVEGLLGRLQTAQMKSIVAANPKPGDLKKYGLDKPTVTATVTSGSSRATLLVGGKTSDNAFYARDTSQPAVVTVDSPVIDGLKRGADEYRRKDLFEFRPYNATHIELSRNGQTIVLDRQKGQGDNAPDTWHRAAPAGDIAKDKMDGLLSKLSNMRAASFVDSTAKTGTDKPALIVTVKYDDGKKEETVTFGQSGSDVFALRPGEPGTAKADTTDFNDVIKTLDEISK